jgi:hypothetical protein
MDYNTDWRGVPQQSKTATVMRTRFVENASVIHVDRAFIRGSTVSGFFKVVNGAEVQARVGKRRIEVECLWFGRKPLNSWMNLTLLSEPTFLNGYSGNVALDIRR